jgi:hypothetical protein
VCVFLQAAEVRVLCASDATSPRQLPRFHRRPRHVFVRLNHSSKNAPAFLNDTLHVSEVLYLQRSERISSYSIVMVQLLLPGPRIDMCLKAIYQSLQHECYDIIVSRVHGQTSNIMSLVRVHT